MHNSNFDSHSTQISCFITDINTDTDARLYSAVPIILIDENDFSAWLKNQNDFICNWTQTQNFCAKPETYCQIPNSKGLLDKILIGYNKNKINTCLYIGHLAKTLPAGIYTLQNFDEFTALAWGMGAYYFSRYKASEKKMPVLILPRSYQANIITVITAIYLIRDLINTPAEDMNPEQLASQAEYTAEKFQANCSQIIGPDLLKYNYPAVYAVGKASSYSPRLIDLIWGNKNHPKLTIVGKGVCFDSGGLDIKTSSGMILMKKDMGGAAHALGLASLIMSFNLPVRLRVLIPAVENAVSGNAYRPGDIISSRKGLSIEIGNTDAEGRLVLCDALTEAVSENPDLLIDFATLTGAARIATGTDLPALFTNDNTIANRLLEIGEIICDPVWRLPLYQPYRKLLDSRIADINNSGSSHYAGAITAALFLKEFVPDNISWLHFDMMAWNVCSTPGHPEGGEAQGLRTVFKYLQDRYCARSSVG